MSAILAILLQSSPFCAGRPWVGKKADESPLMMLVLCSSLTIIEKVIGFMVDMYRSLLMCTIEFVVRGSLAILIGAVETVSRLHIDRLTPFGS